MTKSISAMQNIKAICALLRELYFGESATAKDYRDSYVICRAIESFTELPEVLMTDDLSKTDSNIPKISKSISFRSDCYDKISTISQTLRVSESEVLRRILYYSVDSENIAATVDDSNPKDLQIAALKAKLILLGKQLESATITLNQLTDTILNMEEK